MVRTRLVVIAASAALGGVIGLALHGGDSSHGPGDRTQSVLLGAGEGRLPSETASEWVTYADHVVVVHVSAEEEIPATREETDRGEGMIMRNISFSVDRVLWSADSPARPAPESFPWTAFGWYFHGGTPDDRQEMAAAHSPRFESGHTYLIALDWECGAGGNGRWTSLGEASMVPFDDGVIGAGEFEGRVQDASLRSETENGTDSSALRDRLAGRGADALVAELERAKPSALPGSTDRRTDGDC